MTGARSVPDLRALAGAFADCILTMKIPMMDAIKPVAASPRGKNIRLSELIVYAIAIEAIIEPQ